MREKILMMNKYMSNKMNKHKMYPNKQSLIKEHQFMNLKSNPIKFQHQTHIIKHHFPH